MKVRAANTYNTQITTLEMLFIDQVHGSDKMQE